MRNKIILLAIFCLSLSLHAQQLRYVNTDYILSKMSSYTQAKQTLQMKIDAWKSEISKDQEEINNMQRSLDNEKVIMTDEKIAQQEALIKSKQDKLNEKIEAKFGMNGESQQLRVNLITPLQDQIWNAINKVAKAKGYHMVFDKSQSSNLIYADENYDITEMVIKEMGLDKAQPAAAPQKPAPRTTSPQKGKSEPIDGTKLEDEPSEKKMPPAIKRN